MSALDKALIDHARDVLSVCRRDGLTLAVAESCTGGLLAASLTAVPGSSDVFDRGFVTYSNEAKSEVLGVEPELLAAAGAVSEDVAVAMALGALAASGRSMSASITGIAGPTGGTESKPVGLVHMAAARMDGLVRPKRYVFAGGRDDIRLASTHAALDLLLELVTLRDDVVEDDIETPLGSPDGLNADTNAGAPRRDGS